MAIFNQINCNIIITELFVCGSSVNIYSPRWENKNHLPVVYPLKYILLDGKIKNHLHCTCGLSTNIHFPRWENKNHLLVAYQPIYILKLWDSKMAKKPFTCVLSANIQMYILLDGQKTFTCGLSALLYSHRWANKNIYLWFIRY